MRIVLLGAPGSGKGTLSRYLVDHFHYQHLSTGDLFRKNINEQTPLGIELKNIVVSGTLVSDEITNTVVKNALLTTYANANNLIFDGYPRTVAQAQFLDAITSVDLILLLNVDQNIAVKRIVGRRICPQCKKIYNIYFDPPKKPGICDLDGSILMQRKDDNITTIKQRFATYDAAKLALISYYQKTNKLHQINSDKGIDKLIPTVNKLIKK
ncbi:MAG: nucleoside monophosphate kinase [Mycoplasmataceae bacterium]|jgi:adenylate kinase|nr:nucleoside monophosphate kinase [Mycoplasmataceae bacterium]